MPSLEDIRERFAGDRYAAHSGIIIEEAREGYARCSMVIQPYHLNALNSVQGGALFTLGDFAFAVASSLESRIILDTTGAEKLVGKGDMLYYPLGSGKPQRVQGCLIEDDEVTAVTQYIKEHFEADYSDEVISQVEANAQANEKGTKGGKTAGTELAEDHQDRDELYDDAVEVIVNTGMASVSMLQRRLKLGYSRAARLVDQMEEDGIVGPFQGSKPREVLLSKAEWQEAKLKNGIAQDEFAMAKQMSEAADAAADLPWEEDEMAQEMASEEI